MCTCNNNLSKIIQRTLLKSYLSASFCFFSQVQHLYFGVLVKWHMPLCRIAHTAIVAGKEPNKLQGTLIINSYMYIVRSL